MDFRFLGFLFPLKVLDDDVINLEEYSEISNIKINNKISKVTLLGNYSREGKFDNLFDFNNS